MTRIATAVRIARPIEAVIVYRLHRESGATVFERRLNYTVVGRWPSLLDVLFTRRRMDRESRRVLARLKAILEAGAADTPAAPPDREGRPARGLFTGRLDRQV